MAVTTAELSGPDPVDVAIGARIRIRRKSLGLSQSDLAEGIGLTFQQVQKYERGTNRVSGSKLVAIAAALQTTVGALAGEDAPTSVANSAYSALAMSGAMEMLEAFAAIRKSQTRLALLAIARELADNEAD